MTQPKRFYFSRVEKTNIIADDEETARLELATYYQNSEDFVLDDIREMTVEEYLKMTQGGQ